MKKGIYAFSGDPITFGHIDIIERAMLLFDKLIVGIGDNPAKKYLFSKKERLEMTKEALENVENIEVIAFNGMLSDYIYEHRIPYIIRGLRNGEDFTYELMIHQVNISQGLGAETIYLPCAQGKLHISSGAAKAIQLEQGLIHEYVPINVKKSLEEKISKQIIIGVTGSIATGKSSFCQLLAQDNNIHHIDVDELIYEILECNVVSQYIQIRKEIIQLFGESIVNKEDMIDRKVLGSLVFNDPKLLDQLNQLMKTPALTLIRKKIYSLKGLILLESALLIESGMTFICNNEVVILDVDPILQRERLLKRGYDETQFEKKVNFQLTYGEKFTRMKEIISNDGFGSIYSKDEFESLFVAELAYHWI